MVGYLICSRYDTVWHLMNVSVDPEPPPAGHRERAADVADRADRRPDLAAHARGAALQRGRDHALRALRLPLRRRAAALLPGQRRGRADHVAHARDAAGDARGRAGRRAPARFDPRARDELRRHLRGRRHGGGEVRSNVISSQGVHDRYGGVVPEIASRHHLELVNAVVDDALARAGRGARRRRARRGHAGARARRRAAGRRRDREGAGRRAAAAARAGRPPAGPRRRDVPGAGADGAAVPVPARVGRAHAAGARDRAGRATRCSAARSTTPPARRSTRARGCSGCRIPGGPALSQLATEGDATAFDFPRARARRGPRLLVRGAQDRAALRGARPGGGGDGARAPPTSPPPTSTRSSRRSCCGSSAR